MTPPCFAVVGKVNTGKSSVLATLLEIDDAQLLRISATPGETTQCQRFPVVFDGVELLQFIDTPGFSRPIEAMAEIRALCPSRETPTSEQLREFCQSHAQSGEFADERRLLEPLLEGAGLIYVIDPSKPLRDSFRAEMEILRWTGNPRLALLNQKSEQTEFLPEWKETLGSYFNLVRTFNAHQARFSQRRRLMQSLLEIDESQASTIQTVLSYLDHQWEERREEAAEALLSFLEKSLLHREVMTLSSRDLALEARKQRKLAEMNERYVQKILSYEKRLHQQLLKLYRHHLLTIEQDATPFAEMALFSEETWQKWGLSRTQLTMAGGATGAAGGALIDLGTGGITHGFGTLLGAVGGATAAFFKGGALPDVGFSLKNGLKVESTQGKALQVGPPKSENFPWILLDSALHYYLQIISRTHAVRENTTLQPSSESLTRDLSTAHRHLLAKWFRSCEKGEPNRSMEPEVFSALTTILTALES